MCRVNPLVPCMSAQTARKISNIPASLLVPKSTQLQTHLTKRWFFPYLGGIQATGLDRPLGPSYADPANLSLWTVSLIFFPEASLFRCERPLWLQQQLSAWHPTCPVQEVLLRDRGSCGAKSQRNRLSGTATCSTVVSPSHAEGHPVTRGMSILWFDVTGLGLRASKSLKALSWSPRHKKGQCATHTGMLCS